VEQNDEWLPTPDYPSKESIVLVLRTRTIDDRSEWRHRSDERSAGELGLTHAVTLMV